MAEYDANWTWGIALIAVVVGIGLGIVVAYFALPWARRARNLQKELDGVRADFDGYRGEVTQHFAKTSELFQEMTDRYRAIYEHMAVGAQALCGDTPQTPRLDLPEKQLLPGSALEDAEVEVTGEMPSIEVAPEDLPADVSSKGNGDGVEGTVKGEGDGKDEELEANVMAAPPRPEAAKEATEQEPMAEASATKPPV